MYLRRLALALLLLTTPLCAQTFTTVSATTIQNGSGGLLNAGVACLTPTTSANTSSVITPSGQSAELGPFCSIVTAGAFTNATIPNLATAAPSGLLYTLQVTSALGPTVLSVSGVAITGSTFTFDTYIYQPPAYTTTPTAFGLGIPYSACVPGATYTRTNASAPTLSGWACQPGGAGNIWVQQGQGQTPYFPTSFMTAAQVTQMIANQTGGGGGGGGLNQLTGDGTAGPGTGSQLFTLATVNSSPGTYGDSTHVARVVVNGKGLATGVTSVALSLAALPSNCVVYGLSSITSRCAVATDLAALGVLPNSIDGLAAGINTNGAGNQVWGMDPTGVTQGWRAPSGGCAPGTCVQNSASVDQNVTQSGQSALNVQNLAVVDNVLLNAKASNFISNGASEDQLVNGGEPEALANLLQVPTGSRTINAIGSASLVDMLTCSNASCSHTATNGQDGSLPVSFPLGVTSNTKSQLGFLFNDLSNIGGAPTAANLDYVHGQLLAWGIMFATPDSLKLSTAASCTFTGTWVAVTGSIWPTGAMKATTDGATATCVLPPATDAGIISYKNTGSDGIWSATVTEAGVTHPVTDSYLNTTSIDQTSGTYISAWGGTYDLWAIGVSGLPGGTPTVVMICTHAGSDGCLFVAPYAMAPSGTFQNSPALLIKLVLLQCNNGTCPGAIANHSDAQINLMRNEQLKVANELRANGLNVTAFDGDAGPQGMNPNNVADTGRVPIFTVSAGGTGYANGNLTFSGGGCTVLPTAAAVPLSGGVLATGTYFVTSPGACTSAPTVVFSGGGSGATGAATYASDVHPNVMGAAKIAAAGFTSLNGAVSASDKYASRAASNCDVAGGPNSQFCVNVPAQQMNMLGVYLGFSTSGNSGTLAMNRDPSTGAIIDNTQGAFQLQHIVGSTTPANDTWAFESFPSTGGFVAGAVPFGWNTAGQFAVGNVGGFFLSFCGSELFNVGGCQFSVGPTGIPKVPVLAASTATTPICADSTGRFTLSCSTVMAAETVSTVASASTVAPTTPIVIFTGTTTIDTITPPAGVAALIGTGFDYQTTSGLTFSIAGNIAVLVTKGPLGSGHCTFLGTTNGKWACN